jgi:hypothetical protein
VGCGQSTEAGADDDDVVRRCFAQGCVSKPSYGLGRRL